MEAEVGREGGEQPVDVGLYGGVAGRRRQAEAVLELGPVRDGEGGPPRPGLHREDVALLDAPSDADRDRERAPGGAVGAGRARLDVVDPGPLGVREPPVQPGRGLAERLAEAEQILREWQSNVTESTIGLRREIGDAQTMNDMANLVGELAARSTSTSFASRSPPSSVAKRPS